MRLLLCHFIALLQGSMRKGKARFKASDMPHGRSTGNRYQIAHFPDTAFVKSIRSIETE